MPSQKTNKPIKQETKYVAEWKCKKCKKQNGMWIEQLLFKIGHLNDRIEELELTTKYIIDEINKLQP
jgi:hypothetical protein